MEKVTYKGTEYNVISNSGYDPRFVPHTINLTLQEVSKPPTLPEIFFHLAAGKEVRGRTASYRVRDNRLMFSNNGTDDIRWLDTHSPEFLFNNRLEDCKLV